MEDLKSKAESKLVRWKHQRIFNFVQSLSILYLTEYFTNNIIILIVIVKGFLLVNSVL